MSSPLTKGRTTIGDLPARRHTVPPVKLAMDYAEIVDADVLTIILGHLRREQPCGPSIENFIFGKRSKLKRVEMLGGATPPQEGWGLVAERQAGGRPIRRSKSRNPGEERSRSIAGSTSTFRSQGLRFS
jgi:hypothetical protein